ncbi:CHAT domain-containing protein [Corallococcus sp. M34]|uniref:CHAT domain-containing protein n=1 Tax=Citreicoccus inhibens TaxID=2849499 RepID=UPI001C2358BA|nr:CHAT domain-containing protein [Citreicoccus inhibens]MBU8896422.1 CHAT domain-containing protein [Citreicoccus inhibens]
MLKPAYDKLWALALAAPVIAVAVAVVRMPSRGVPEEFWAERRAAARIEARLSHPEADRYRTRATAGGCPVPPEPIPLRDLAKMEEQGDWSGIAAAYALQGEWNQAASFLERLPASPDRDSDLGAVYLSRGNYEQALRLLDGALAQKPQHPQALWNRALVLREMGLTLRASETFEQVAALNEQGWGREAHAQGIGLRESTLERAREWKAATASMRAWMENDQAPLPIAEARSLPSTVRQGLYEALRAAPSKQRALALMPLAQELDRLQGGTSLVDYVKRVSTLDFNRRAPLANAYAEMVRAGTPPDAVLDKFKATADDDLFMGTVLMRPNFAQRHFPEFLARAKKQSDPWFSLIVESELARKEYADGEWWKAEQRLFSALKVCREGALSARCVDLEVKLGRLYVDLQRVTEAERHARIAWAWARQLREWNLESQSLEMLVHLTRSRSDFASARAYLEEWIARTGRDTFCYWPHVNLAHIHYMDQHPEDARRELDIAAKCPDVNADLMFGATMVELARLGTRPGDAEWVRKAVDSASSGPNVFPGDVVYGHYLEGRFVLDSDRVQGQAMLTRVIDEAEKLPHGDMLGREAWAYSYSSLAVDAGRAQEFGRALELLARQLGAPVPKRCALAAAVHYERTVVVAVDAQGTVRGFYEPSRAEAFARTDSSKLIPTALLQSVRSCAQVEVLAWPPVFGRTELLPPDMAWSFRVGRGGGRMASPTNPRRLVVSSVETPSLLQLPRLPAWMPAADSEAGAMELLTGSDATPTRVLAGMTDATEIEIHAHGIVDPTLSDASLVVLSPEDNGRYALTADVVRKQKLNGSPTVFLAACSAGRLTTNATHEPFSLPAAFIDAGARAVLASTVDIPDAAGRFFDGVRQRIRAGSPPAVALRDERQKWLARDARSDWTRFVLLVETGD